MKSFKIDRGSEVDVIDLSTLPEHVRELLRQFAGGSAMGIDFPNAAKASGLSRSWLYGAARRGELRVTKAGRKSLILVPDMLDYLKRLPRGTFKPPVGAVDDKPEVEVEPDFAVVLADIKRQLIQLQRMIAGVEMRTAQPEK